MTTLLAMGECMVELSHTGEDQLKLGFAGDSSNACIYLKRSAPEVTVQYLTALGDDDYSEQILDMWRQEGIDTSLVRRITGELPGLSIIRNTPDGERSFYYWRGQSAYKRLPGLFEPDYRLPRTDYLYVSGITLAATLPEYRQRILQLIKHAAEAGSQLIFDPNYRARLWSPEEALSVITDILPETDLFLTSIEDLEQLTPDADGFLKDASAVCPELVLRRGSDSCFVYREGQALEIPAITTKAADTTGAGDSFNGTYIASRIRGNDPESAARAAHQVAAEVIQHKGAITPRGD